MNAPIVNNQAKNDWLTFLKDGASMTEQEVKDKIKTPEVLEAFNRAKISELPGKVLEAYEGEDKKYDQYSEHTARNIILATAEVSRNAAEQIAMAKAEAARNAAEQIAMAKAEAARNAAEQIATARDETTRANEETTRARDETTRANEETTRANEETTRARDEAARNAAEAATAKAEAATAKAEAAQLAQQLTLKMITPVTMSDPKSLPSGSAVEEIQK